MYQKIKYIIIATMFLLICVVVLTLDANTRYNAAKKDRNGIQREQAEQIKQNYYAHQQLSEQNQNTKAKQDVPDDVMKKFEELSANQNNAKNISMENGTEDIENEEEAYKSYRKYRNNLQQDTEQNTQNTQSTQTTTEKILTIITLPSGYIVDSAGKRLENYKIEKCFKIKNDEFAVISDSGSTNLSSSAYVQKKFYIYKKVDDTYRMSNYLFETTESSGQTAPAEISLSDTEGTLTVNYSGTTHIKRNVDNYQLKSSYLQYMSSYPALKYQEQSAEESTNNAAQPAQNEQSSSVSNGLQPLPQLPEEK